MSTVLILGARGRFGAAATQAYAEAGWQVLAQARRAPDVLPAGKVRHLPIALDDTEALVTAAAGATWVVHAVNPVYTRWDDELLPLWQQAIDLARRLGARLLLPGNVYPFGESMPPQLDADTPARPSTAKGRLRQQMEAMLRDSGVDGVVLRAGDFYGTGAGSWLDQAIVKDLPRGRLVYPGPPDVPHAWAYLPDLARAAVALSSAALPPGVHDVPFEGHTLTGRQLLDAVTQAAASLGLEPAGGFKRSTMPWGLIRVAGLVWPMGRELGRMSYLWRVPHQLGGDRLRALAGPLPATPLVAALRESLLAMGVARPALGYR